MNNETYYINYYNKNIYIDILRVLYKRLPLIKQFLKSISVEGNFRNIEDLTDKYQYIFSSEELLGHIDFKINRIYKALYLQNPGPMHIGNSSYHLILRLKSKEIIWLDDIYGQKLYRIIRLYKHLFSRIDRYYNSQNKNQIEKYQATLINIGSEVSKFLKSSTNRDIVEKREKLKPEQLDKIPFDGLFYTTHVDNIESILYHGILSHNNAHNEGLVKVDISNPNINASRNRIVKELSGNIHDYAPLYFTFKNPAYRSFSKKVRNDNLILLKINPHILLYDNVAFSDGNAATISTKFYKSINDFNKLKWEVLNGEYWANHTDGERIICSEVLVKDKIPLFYITELIVQNEETLKKVIPMFPNHLGINTSVGNKLFYYNLH